MKKAIVVALAALFAAWANASTAASVDRPVPYWASISAGQARMRTGPGRNFPASWLYQRADLPVKVIEVYPSWRKIEDPDGTRGWMMAKLLSDRRTAIVTAETSGLRVAPNDTARSVARVEPGVVGRISHCVDGWCAFDVHGRSGYVEIAHLWGVTPGEAVE